MSNYTHRNGTVDLHEISYDKLFKNEGDNHILNITLDASGQINPFGKINGTDVTIFDIVAHDEKVKIGDNLFQKTCNSMNKCFVANCKEKHDDKKKNKCKIY